MSEPEEKVRSFLKSYSMHPSDIDMEICCEAFLAEMKAGLADKDNSLDMILTYIETDKELPKNESVIVMDAGGTNFRAAIAHFDGAGKAVIKNLRKRPMPGIEKVISRDEFFDTLTDYIKDIIEASSRIGFCFSYPCEALPNKDGKPIRFVKEINLQEVLGHRIGENLNVAIARFGFTGQKSIVILNDTVATLLAGMAGFEDKNYDGYIGFILGTGTNTCYVEKNSNIIKNRNLVPDKCQIINVESGGFGKMPRSKIDEQFDASTNDPGVYKFEKMISGAYLGPLILEAIRTAANDGLFSSAAAEKLLNIKTLDTKQVSDFLTEPTAPFHPLAQALLEAGNYDKTMLESLVKSLVERAAKLTAVNLSAAVLKSDKGKNPERPVCIVAEGTTFYNLPGLKDKALEYLNEFLVKQKGRYYEIVYVENATLIGAAIAGLTNSN